MALAFSESTNNTGIVEQSRFLARIDSTQWPTDRIANSCNSWKDFLTGLALEADRRFQWDNTNQTDLPEGTIDSTTSSDYSFLTDQNGNNIITLLGVSRLDSSTGYYIPLTEVDRNDPSVDLSSFGTTVGTPTAYDKIADNVFRIDYKVGSVISNYFKLFFQRSGPYFTKTDTTTKTGFSPLLDRGFIVASAYDAALSLGLPNLVGLAAERNKEEEKARQYFADRNQDMTKRMVANVENTE